MATASESEQNFLKAIYQLSHETNHETGASALEIANTVGVSPAAVTKMLRQLSQHSLVSYTPYKPVLLTALGEKLALEVIRHHRLLETYLVEGLGYGWDTVHTEAEKLEHHISEEFEATIERLLNFPSFDPHGDPIPTRDGQLPTKVTQTLLNQPDGAQVTVYRVSDEDGQMLRYFAELELRPGAQVEVIGREPYGGSLELIVCGHKHRLAPEAAAHVFVVAVPFETIKSP